MHSGVRRCIAVPWKWNEGQLLFGAFILHCTVLYYRVSLLLCVLLGQAHCGLI